MGTYLTNSWKQGQDGKWYYLNEDGWMAERYNYTGWFYVDADGVWVKMQPIDSK